MQNVSHLGAPYRQSKQVKSSNLDKHNLIQSNYNPIHYRPIQSNITYKDAFLMKYSL